jgi:hypothetical protein
MSVDMVPAIKLELRNRDCREVSRPNSVGMVPERELVYRLRDCREVSIPNSVGKVPEMELASKDRSRRDVISPVSVGMVPVREPVLTSIVCRELISPISVGIDPRKSDPSKLISVTLLLVSQVTPAQVVVNGPVQTTGGADRLQAASQPWGTVPLDPGSARASAHKATSSGLVENDTRGRMKIIVISTIKREREEGKMPLMADELHHETRKPRSEIITASITQQ